MENLKSKETALDTKSGSTLLMPDFYSTKNSKTVRPRVQSSLDYVNQGSASKAEPLRKPILNTLMVDRIDPAKNDLNSPFSEVDKRLLKFLLHSDGKLSSLALSRRMEIPCTTIQRRRKRLEAEFLERYYCLRLDRLGWRTADLLVSTTKGTSSAVGKEMLNLNTITRVQRTIGEHTIDLRAEIMFRNNNELSNAIEWIKSLDGVKHVLWTEPVETLGKNTSAQYEIIDAYS